MPGYACYPYNHTHDSIGLKEEWEASGNVDSVHFATATFAQGAKPYFRQSNHYLLARVSDGAEAAGQVSARRQTADAFVFEVEDLFEREVDGGTSFVSAYYLEYGEDDDMAEIADIVAKRENISRAGVGSMETYGAEPPKFRFPYSGSIVVLEVVSQKGHQSVNKYCEKTRSDIARRGYSLTGLVGLSILEKLK